MRYVIGLLFALALALVQASSIDQFRALGVSPNLVLVLLVCWLVVRGLDDVLPMVACAGMTTGLLGLQSPGLVMLALLLPIALLGFVRELHIIHSDALLAVASVGAATVLYESVILAGVLATGGVLDPVTAYSEVVAPAILVNLSITLPVYLIMRLARPAPRPRFSY
jgi:hypothetical protein